jgi:general secretion pathway protein H
MPAQSLGQARVRGFSLIERLVVMLVIGIALAMVSINGLPGAREGLRFETERLAQLLSLAREEAQVRGAPIRLEVDDRRYIFSILRNNQWRPLLDDQDLRERSWQAPTQIVVSRPDGRREVEFGRDAVDLPFRIVLRREGSEAVIEANGLGVFEVR